MSLTTKQLLLAFEAWDRMEKRLINLFGFNPATSNHYGKIQLYNEIIDSETTDETIIEIRTKFLKWKEDIMAIFAEKQFYPNTKQLNGLFDVDPMYGTLFFLDEPVDINKSAEVYRERIFNLLEGLEKS